MFKILGAPLGCGTEGAWVGAGVVAGSLLPVVTGSCPIIFRAFDSYIALAVL
jgi:hypothetical protein